MFLKISQKLPVSVTFADKFGNPAKVDGVPAWSLSDPSLGAIAPSDDGLSAVYTPGNATGSLKIQVAADADLGEGVKSILGELQVDLLAGDAATVTITAGDPSDA